MTQKKIVIVNGDDWQGIYINGKLYYEGHSIPNHIVLEALDAPYETTECDSNWLEECGNLPKNLEEVRVKK